MSTIYFGTDFGGSSPRTNAIIIGITEVSDATDVKRKRKSRAQLTQGRQLSFYEVIEKIRTRYGAFRSHPSESMVYWGRPMSIFHVASRQIGVVMEAAMLGRIYEVIYPAGYACRCNDCLLARAKKPRGPKRQPNGTILIDHYRKYRGALGFEELQALRPLVVDLNGERTFKDFV